MTTCNTARRHPTFAVLALVFTLVVITVTGCRSKERRLPGEDLQEARITSPGHLRAMAVNPPTPRQYLAYVGTRNRYHVFMLQDNGNIRHYMVVASDLPLSETFSTNRADRRYAVPTDTSIRLIPESDAPF